MVIITAAHLSATSAAEIITRQARVVIDPGHSPESPGLVTPAGLNEAQATLELAQLTAKALSGDCHTLITPQTDQPNLDNPETTGQRAAFANQNHADVFISLHMHHIAPHAVSVFYYDIPESSPKNQWQNQSVKSKAHSKKLAETLAAHLRKIQHCQTAVLSAPLLTLEGASAPAALVEIAPVTRMPASANARHLQLIEYADNLAGAVKEFLKKHN